MSDSIPTSRRRFLQAGAATAAGLVLPAWASSNSAPAIIAAESERPQALQGLHFGDPATARSSCGAAATDRPACSSNGRAMNSSARRNACVAPTRWT